MCYLHLLLEAYKVYAVLLSAKMLHIFWIEKKNQQFAMYSFHFIKYRIKKKTIGMVLML